MSSVARKKPLASGEKSRYVRAMFATIAPRYDQLNSILSFHRHHAWRQRAVRLAKVRAGERCLDVCTGTGDFALALARAVGEQGTVLGADFCVPMLQIGLQKIRNGAYKQVKMAVADAQNLPYSSASFDVVTVGFGVRNVACLEKALAEMVRVTRPGGRVVILEFTRPRPSLLRPLLDLYLFKILPSIGGWLSRKEAYTYLPESIAQFVSREELAEAMKRAGLTQITIYDLNFGTVCIHIGVRPAYNGEVLQ
ncbi:MAG TPA: bifunctional demethylmenaquinone methyltransferase/2-methoxy-6-polyprenyl-1,4-benzoquinol methylase UbiE [Chthonomonas sp.]|jgi:demethylmenaquinone methyltransferase/2-methoxy-6-polyprenyl-1,4-benzoquinol methylase|uniref:bifunctional demethylmenaquinone methyltransferase/2-methoxy-6-polyprenyl-1,4-benzoquinol methylase UbiE n=1 Tax=Chthonomonas sp. TaxID=2282153 RepID=UPI002B4B7582|nr:bifunctional demethylmenaquinone methyltransferase/2-methoxy-6-polyprenyl-1,4-benzoquinol methylase UbiE [Chthonomonas sp.]HLH79376.1 bifunctional demethylmenaquinone methyltransferase/2-methoxy-6-polyprenyl-1,4-benzoquinol methylase UbiE [Chthonomonas sp.]